MTGVIVKAQDCPCQHPEFDDLMAIYDALGGENWYHNHKWGECNLVNKNGNYWSGVTFSGPKIVTCDTFYSVSKIEFTSASSVPISGSLPPEIGNLTNLEVLTISVKDISGSIPSEIGNLSNLQELRLSGNNISGSIPATLGNLTNLEVLDLAGNDLSGSIQPALGNLGNLEELSLGGNQLIGPIPANLGNLSQLKKLYLSSNNLSGSIPPALGNLSNLASLTLHDNELSGSIPSSLGNLNSIEYIDMTRNQINGPIPSELGNLSSLKYWYMRDNQISGSIPPELGNLSNLIELKLDRNILSGSIPSEFGNLSNLRILWMQLNDLTGTLPATLGNLNELRDLILYSNDIGGFIPPELGNLNNIYEIDLDYNELSGPIPSELGNFTNLRYLRFLGNQLEGCIPFSFVRYCASSVFVDLRFNDTTPSRLTDFCDQIENNTLDPECEEPTEISHEYEDGSIVAGPIPLDNSLLKVSADSGFSMIKITGLDGFSIELIASNTNGSIEEGGVIEQIPGINTFKYTHPSFVSTFDKTVSFLVKNGNTELGEITIEVYRPPLVCIHGLWSGEQSFWPMLNSLKSQGYIHDQMTSVNYSQTHDSPFSVNTVKVPDWIDSAIEDVSERHDIATLKVDIVSHSMGGLLARSYLQSDSYRDDINRLITINTPHSGSQGADFLYSQFDSDNVFIESANIGINNLFEFFRAGLCMVMSSTFGTGFDNENTCINSGAINDLRSQSTAIKDELNGSDKNKNKVPSHTIATTEIPTNLILIPAVQSGFEFIEDPSLYMMMILLKKSLQIDFLTTMYDGPSDLIVSLPSQQGGLTGNMTTIIQNQIHVGAQGNPQVINKVKSLLSLDPINSGSFETQGFAPPMIDFDLTTFFKTESVKKSISNPSISFISPTNNDIYFPGDIINIEIEANPTITDIILVIESENGYYRKEQAGNTLTTQFEVSPETLANGRRKIYGVGYDPTINKHIIVYDEIQINPCPVNLYAQNKIKGENRVDAKYTVEKNISSEQKILSGDIEYSAGTQILLNSDFRVDAGATFEALIEGCDSPLGCTKSDAHNFNELADLDDGSCLTCYDGILNGDEQGIDCGGISCNPCIDASSFEETAIILQLADEVDIFDDYVLLGNLEDDEVAVDAGAAYVMEKDYLGENNWGERKKLIAPDGDGGILGQFNYSNFPDKTGNSIAIDGNIAVIGSIFNDEKGKDSGAVYIFVKDHGGIDNWGLQKKISASDGTIDDRFGQSVSISGDNIVISSSRDDDNGSNSGSAHIFSKDHGGANNWGQVKKISPSDGADSDYFGESVSISGENIIISSSRDDDNGSNSGSAYIFSKDSGGVNNWGQVKKILPSDGAGSDFFGKSVSISGNVFVITSHYDDDNGSNSGSAYIFSKDHGGANNWGQVKKILPSDGTGNDRFGISASIDNHIIVIGAYFDLDQVGNRGSVYVFSKNEGGVNNWGEAKKLVPNNGPWQNFGTNVSIHKDQIIVSSLYSIGKSYIFQAQ